MKLGRKLKSLVQRVRGRKRASTKPTGALIAPHVENRPTDGGAAAIPNSFEARSLPTADSQNHQPRRLSKILEVPEDLQDTESIGPAVWDEQ